MKRTYLCPEIISICIISTPMMAGSELHNQGNGTTTGGTNPGEEFNGEFNAKTSIFDYDMSEEMDDF